MKLRYILFAGSIAAATSLATTSCSDSFFEEYPSNSVTEGNHYKTDDDFNQSVRGCYHRLRAHTSFFVTELAYRSDESLLEQMATSTQDRYNLDNFVENPANGICKSLWTNTYNGIYRCNDVLDHMAGRTDLPNYNKYRGELLTLRAWFYFTLYRSFGVVPLSAKVVTPAESMTVPRCTEEEMFKFLYDDLREAATLLPETRGAESARLTASAANALLGKVCLTFGKYAEANAALDQVIADPIYDLETSTARVFDVKNKMNKEIIFVINYNKSDDMGHGLWFSANPTEMERIHNPDPKFVAIYDQNDNRRKLLTEYTPVGNLMALAKWYDTYDATYTTQVGNDLPLIRYSDVVLMKAEALAPTNIGDALVWLNKTHTRAGLDEITSAEVPDLASFKRALALERGCEFALEGQRWFDLIRLGLALETMQALGYNMDAHNLLMPIPQAQIEIVGNPEILWQNPGF